MNHPPLPGAYSITEFCAAFGGMTRQHFHSISKSGKGPRIFKVGRRTLISHEAANDWVRKMEGQYEQEKQK